jgi:hypothetical protein
MVVYVNQTLFYFSTDRIVNKQLKSNNHLQNSWYRTWLFGRDLFSVAMQVFPDGHLPLSHCCVFP